MLDFDESSHAARLIEVGTGLSSPNNFTTHAIERKDSHQLQQLRHRRPQTVEVCLCVSASWSRGIWTKLLATDPCTCENLGCASNRTQRVSHKAPLAAEGF